MRGMPVTDSVATSEPTEAVETPTVTDLVDDIIVPTAAAAKEMPRRGRGRPRKNPLPAPAQQPTAEFSATPQGAKVSINLPKPVLSRDEMYQRALTLLTDLLRSGTGVGSFINPHIPMYEDEARSIAAPLISILVQRLGTIEKVVELLEKSAILTLIFASAGYGGRVIGDIRRDNYDRRTIDQVSNNSRPAPEQSGASAPVNTSGGVEYGADSGAQLDHVWADGGEPATI